jgi:plasmid replication initiation protein
MANDLVVKSNTLINASHYLSLVEQRLIGLAIIKAREIKVPLTDSVMLEVRANDYMEAFGVDRATAYQALKEAVDKLFDRHFEYDMYIVSSFEREGVGYISPTPPKEFLDGDAEIELKGRWVEKVGYTKDKGTVLIQFASDIIPFLTDLKSYFTQYYLSQTVELTSSYAFRLFEIVMQWQSVGKTPVIPITELRGRLGVAEGRYTEMHNFKKRVLDVAIEQVSQGDYTVTYKQYKTGRTISGIEFFFTANKKKKLAKGDSVKRDQNTADLFSGYTDKQLARAVHSKKFMIDYGHMISSSNSANQSSSAWIAHMVEWVKKDSASFNKRPMQEYLDDEQAPNF